MSVRKDQHDGLISFGVFHDLDGKKRAPVGCSRSISLGITTFMPGCVRDAFERSRTAFDLVVWLNAAHRLPPEPGGSMGLTVPDAGWVMDNNGPAEALPGEVAKRITDDCLLSDALFPSWLSAGLGPRRNSLRC